MPRPIDAPQCHAIARQSGERCKKAAQPGDRLCRYHAFRYRHPEAVSTYAARDEGRNRWWREVYPVLKERGLAHLVQPGRPKGKMVKGIGRAYQIILRAKAKIMNDLEAVGGSLEKPSEELNAAEKLAALNIHALDTVQDQLDRLGRLAGQAEQAGELEEARKAATAAANVALSTTRLQVRVDENTMRLRKKSDLALVLEAFQREIGQGAKIEAGPSAKDL